MNRRLFMRSSAMALAGFAAVPSFLKRTVLAAPGSGGGDSPVLIVVFQRGAADGMSMLVPFGDPGYYKARPQIALAAPGRNGSGALDLDGFYGLHPALSPLKRIYDQGHLAPLHAIGSPDSTRSHFDAQDYMETATPGRKGTRDGWLNRYLLGTGEPEDSPFRAVAFGSALPRTLLGDAPALAMSSIDGFGVQERSGNTFESLYASSSDGLQSAGKEMFEAMQMLKKADPARYTPRNGALYPNSRLGTSLRQIAQLIKAQVGLEVAFADCEGWDTHANQGGATGQLANRLREFADALWALYADLGDRMRNVVVLTMTEFGRTLKQNGTGGTDHGHASSLFVMGGPVAGGSVYGRWPGLAPEQLYEGRDLEVTTDFRDLFAEVAARHMGAHDLRAIFPGYDSGSGRALGIIS